MSTTTLYNEKKKTLIPQLRFRGFEGDWKEKKIGKVFKINAGGDIDNERVSFEKTEKFKYPIYANAKKDKGFYGYSDIYKIESGTITVAGRGVYIGIAHARDHQYYPIVRLLVLKPLANEDIYFSENVINRLNLFVESTGVPQLTAPQFSNYKISLPTLPEQQKIASFLSVVDEKIQQLSRKKELLEKYKKGVMQQLFSGKLRFKDENGNDYADWEEKKLGLITNIKKGKQLNKIELTETGDYLCINGGISPSGYTDNFNTLENTITISEGGNSCGFVNFFRCKFWSGGHNYTIEIINPEETNIDFMFQILKQNQIEIMSLRVGSGLPNIQKKDLVAYPLNLPSSIKEQQKIANFLSSIDAKIESTSQQINQTQSFKKGLLQKMFV